jgi:hypothetical protein
VHAERATADRLAAYSDAVFAVIVTIMVLELRAPDQPAFSALWLLWPTAISYVVSYLFIAIIWINLPCTCPSVCGRLATRRSLVVLAVFTTAMLVAFVTPRLGFGLICGALLLHLRPEVRGSGL